MNVSEKSRRVISKITLVLLIIACSEVSAQSEVKSITILLDEQKPAGCQLLGRVTGSSQDTQEDNIPYTGRLIDARNNLRNETHKLGGNTVHIRHASTSGKYEVPGADKKITFIGDAYHCE